MGKEINWCTILFGQTVCFFVNSDGNDKVLLPAYKKFMSWRLNNFGVNLIESEGFFKRTNCFSSAIPFVHSLF